MNSLEYLQKLNDIRDGPPEELDPSEVLRRYQELFALADQMVQDGLPGYMKAMQEPEIRHVAIDDVLISRCPSVPRVEMAEILGPIARTFILYQFEGV